RSQRRRDYPFRAHLWAFASAASRGDQPRASLAGHRKFLDRVVQPLHLSGRPPESGDAFADHVEGADLWAERRYCRGTNDLAAGKTRRRQELGLSLLLAARRHLYAVGADELWLYRGSPGLAQLAAARCGRLACEYADHVRHYGPAAPA